MRYRILKQIIEQIHPQRILEIGTWRAKRAKGMIEASQCFAGDREIEYYGFDLFSPPPAEELGKGDPLVEQAAHEKLAATKARVRLFAGNTKETLPNVLKQLPPMDLIFIDGGHSLDTIASDWRYCQQLMHPRTVVVFDDYWLNRLDAGAKQTVDNISRTDYSVELLEPIDVFQKRSGDLRIQMAKVMEKQFQMVEGKENIAPVLVHCSHSGWIIARAAQELVQRLPQVEMAEGRIGNINYSIPYSACKDCNEGIRIGLYTHKQSRRKFKSAVQRHDYHVGMSKKTCDILRDYGVENPWHIPLGTDLCKDITFGVVGRTYRSGRKGEYLVRHAVESGYNVVAWGKGWPCNIVSGDFDQIEAFYRSIDYLLVTSLNEGGPMVVIEAIALGVPVIAPDVGWCWEYPVIRYERGNWESLESVLHGLTHVPTWQQWAEDHQKLFAHIEQSQL